jgi:hypothetical protein
MRYVSHSVEQVRRGGSKGVCVTLGLRVLN